MIERKQHVQLHQSLHRVPRRRWLFQSLLPPQALPTLFVTPSHAAGGRIRQGLLAIWRRLLLHPRHRHLREREPDPAEPVRYRAGADAQLDGRCDVSLAGCAVAADRHELRHLEPLGRLRRPARVRNVGSRSHLRQSGVLGGRCHGPRSRAPRYSTSPGRRPNSARRYRRNPGATCAASAARASCTRGDAALPQSHSHIFRKIVP